MNVYQLDSAVKNIQAILTNAESKEQQLTLLKLLTIWMQTCPKNIVVSSVEKLKLSPELAEFLIGVLYNNKVIKIDKGYNNYSTICYIEFGSYPGRLTLTTRHNLVGFPKVEAGEPAKKKRKAEDDVIVVE